MIKEFFRGAVDELVMVMEEVDRKVAEGADQIATFPDLVDPLRF